jgi:Tfp pilus assembly protein PilZ
MPELRRQPRVAYQTNIRVRPAGADESVVARMQNLSASGMFVTAPGLPAAGTDVLCRMLVAGERCTLKGKVAWVRQASATDEAEDEPGAGIRFVDLNPRASGLLERLLAPALGLADPAAPAEEPVQVDVWFEGLRAPIRSQAAVADDALRISTRLPFLRLTSPVRLTFVRRGVEEVRTGFVEAVTLEPSASDGVPRLQVTVQTPIPDKVQGIIEVPDALTFSPPDMMVSEPLMVVDPAAVVPPPRARPPLEVTPRPMGAPVVASTVAFEETLTQRLAREQPITPAPPVAIPTPQPPRRRPPSVLRLGVGLAMLAGVAAGYLLLRAPPPPAALRGRTQARLSPVQIELVPIGTPVPPAESVAVRHPTPGEQLAVPSTPAAPAAPVLVPVPAPVPAALSGDVAASAEHRGGGLGVTTGTDTSSILVALVGSSKGMQYYRLADPPGVVVTLPHGRPRSGAGSHSPGGPFRRVIVGRRAASYVVRIYFTADLIPEVASESGGVRVTLRPKRGTRRA